MRENIVSLESFHFYFLLELILPKYKNYYLKNLALSLKLKNFAELFTSYCHSFVYKVSLLYLERFCHVQMFTSTSILSASH